MYILYGGRFTRALLTEMVLLEAGLPYELREIDIVAHEHLGPEYLAVNPAGRVPALLTPEGQTLYETPAISLYLADHHALSHLAPRIEEPNRGPFLSGLFYVTDELEPALKRVFYPHRYVVREDDAPAMKALALEQSLERVGVVERRLAEGGPYHLGERFSLVDLTFAFWTAQLDGLDDCPAVRRCLDLVRARPLLGPKFDEMAAWAEEYAQMQTRGEDFR